MKAWVLHQTGFLRLETAAEPKLAEDEVLIAVKAAGICGSDIPRIYRDGAYSYPLIPGHEFSGIAVQAGKKADQVWVGKRVGIYPLIPCGICGPCRKKQYEMCRNYSYSGSRRNGGFAEYAAVPQRNLIELKDSVSFEAAAMMEPMAVAVHAMRRADLEETDRIVICGLGTIGMLLFMFLQEAAGSNGMDAANIFVIGNKDYQKQMVISLGLPLDHFCDSRLQNVHQWLLECTGGTGVDIFFECVGRNETLIQAVNSTAPAGKVILVGNPATDMTLEQAVYWKILRNQLTLTGSWNSAFLHDAEDDWHYVQERLSESRIQPERIISHRFAFEDLEQGFHIMKNKSQDYIKIMGIMA